MFSDFSLGFLILCSVVGFLAVRGILSGRGVFEFPAAASMLALAWMVPQGFQLERDSGKSPDLDWFWIYLALCFVCIWVGFELGRKGGPIRVNTHRGRHYQSSFDRQKLTISAAGLVGFGILNRLLIGGADTSEMGSSWTGVITMYALFTGAIPFGLCLAMLTYVRTKSTVSLAIAIIAAIPLLETALIGVRREIIFDLLITSGGAYYMAKKKAPPRTAILLMFIAATLVLNVVGDIRGFVSSGKGNLINALQSEQITRGFSYTGLDQGKASELGLSYHDFSYINETREFEFGANYWNALLNQYIPAFLLGREFKTNLMVETLDRRAAQDTGDLAFSTGSTRTGFSDSYRSFGWFGVFIFGFIGYLFGRIYKPAVQGRLVAQYFYLVLMGTGLKSITHSTAEFVSALPFIISTSIIALQFARSRGHNAGIAARQKLPVRINPNFGSAPKKSGSQN